VASKVLLELLSGIFNELFKIKNVDKIKKNVKKRKKTFFYIYGPRHYTP